MLNRRAFLVQLAALTGSTVVWPTTAVAAPSQQKLETLMTVPLARPDDWNAVEFNLLRGNAGAVPLTYLAELNAPDSDKQYLGMHLPYLPRVEKTLLPKGFIALMWGDAAKGQVPHPQAPADAARRFPGHWFDWIRLRKSGNGNFKEVESRYGNWPQVQASDNGAYAVYGKGSLTEDEGRNTIYLAALPPDVAPNDTLRVWGHCRLHGEYVDFLKLG